MKKYTVVAITLLFAVLTVVYFRQMIGSPSDALLTHHLASDLYGHFVHVWERLELLGKGFVPIGDYWVQRGGGYPAAFNDRLFIPQEFLLMISYALTGSFAISLKILIPMFYFATLITAYWYGTVIFRRRDISVVLAVAYAFSVYGVNQLEHLELIGVQPLILLALIYLEKTLHEGKTRHIVLTGMLLSLVFLSNLYALYFTLLFVGFRIVFHLIAMRYQWLKTLKSTAKVGVLFSLTAIPILLLQLLTMPSHSIRDFRCQELFAYSQPPSSYFFRNAPFMPHLTEIQVMYLGLSVLMLALVPMILKQTSRSSYIFYLLVTVFFLLYSIGQYGPVNLAVWFHNHVPVTFFIRVPGRSLMIGYLSLSVCTAIGLGILIDKVKQHRWKPPLILLVALVIFADLTIGFEPTTMPEYFRNNATHRFIREQPEDFRIVEVPAVYCQAAMTNISTGRDALSSMLWGFGHFEPLNNFMGLYYSYTQLSATAQKAALYGVKYVVVNTDPQYFDTFKKDLVLVNSPGLTQTQKVDAWLRNSSDYKLVHSEAHVNVYENLEFRGMLFSDGADYLCWSRRDPNTLVIDVESSMPTSIIVSQSFADGWVAETEDGTLPVYDYNSILGIEVPKGSHHIVLHYQYYESSLLAGLAFYVALLIVGVAMWRRKVLLILLAYGVGLTVFSLTCYPYIGSLYQTALTGLGAALIVGAGSSFALGRNR